MKEINIARAIARKRREKGITQDELANYIGVSKASVSKWETGQSYPDITFLPQLATYFNISIDELMNYEPQMTKEDMRELYHQLSIDFSNKPFDEVLDHCHQVMNKYYSCFPLLFQIGALLVNYSSMNQDVPGIIAEAKEIFVKVRKESDDATLATQALSMEAFCQLTLGKPETVLELLGETIPPALTVETLLASAFHMTGKVNKAEEVLQVGIYQHVNTLLGILPSHLLLNQDNEAYFEEIYRRAIGITEIFNIETFHPSMMFNIYLAAAQGFLHHGKRDKALESLEKYTTIATRNIYPLELKGDDFFSSLDDWLEAFPLGKEPPRDEKAIKQSIVSTVTENPAFSDLSGDKHFDRITKKLKSIL